MIFEFLGALGAEVVVVCRYSISTMLQMLL